MFIIHEVGKQRGISVGFALAKELNERWKKVYDDQNTQWNNFLFQLTGMDVLSTIKDNKEPEPVKPKLSLVKKDE
jgi:hypothetical protein